MTATLILDIIQSLSPLATLVLGFYMKNRVKKSDTLVVQKIDNVHSDVIEVRKEQTKSNNKDVCVLVLDDNPDDLKAVERIVKRTGKKYDLYLDDKLFLAGIPDGINVHIIDHFLPNMSGLDILREIKEKNTNNFVIAYTGSKNENTVIEYVNAGINKFVDKNNPDHLQQLAKYLNEGIKVSSNK